MMAMGHAVTLFCYDEPQGVPEGVAIADAATILPRGAIIYHQSGSVALFSDRFRFELQRRGLGLWLDTDMYLLQPLDFASTATVFGWLDHLALGAAVLQLPADSPVITEVLALFDEPFIPSWLRLPDRLRATWRARRTGRVDLATLPWGVAGPAALTALSRRAGLLHHAQPCDVFYPYGWQEADWIFDPQRSLDSVITARTRAIHLYNYMIADRKEAFALPGSFMHRLQQEGA